MSRKKCGGAEKVVSVALNLIARRQPGRKTTGRIIVSTIEKWLETGLAVGGSGCANDRMSS
jgi:hypothetical protein